MTAYAVALWRVMQMSSSEVARPAPAATCAGARGWCSAYLSWAARSAPQRGAQRKKHSAAGRPMPPACLPAATEHRLRRRSSRFLISALQDASRKRSCSPLCPHTCERTTGPSCRGSPASTAPQPASCAAAAPGVLSSSRDKAMSAFGSKAWGIGVGWVWVWGGVWGGAKEDRASGEAYSARQVNTEEQLPRSRGQERRR